MARFGTVWTDPPRASMWDWMWAQRVGSVMTEQLLEAAASVERVCEVGCGFGHVLEALLERGWRGVYHGFDFSIAGVEQAQTIIQRAGLANSAAVAGDFLDACAEGRVPPADVVIGQAVVEHQCHWAPLTLAGLRVAPRVVWGIGYSTELEDRHSVTWKDAGHYDVSYSPTLMQREAAGMGVDLRILRVTNPRRPRALELIASARLVEDGG